MINNSLFFAGLHHETTSGLLSGLPHHSICGLYADDSPDSPKQHG